MKTFLFCISLLTFSTLLTGQSFNGGSAATTGFGEIGVVATNGNYQSAYFQNPALLVQGNQQLDVFLNYGKQVLEFDAVSGGMMFRFDENAIGIGFEHASTSLFDNPLITYNLIPIAYARNLYQTDKAGISIGANLNIHHQSFDLTRLVIISPTTVTPDLSSDTYLTGGVGLNAYRILKLNDKNELKFSIGSSINSIGSDVDILGSSVAVRNHYKVGSMIGWTRSFMNGRSLNLNLAYQYNERAEYGSILEGNQNWGIEFRCEDSYISWAIRGGYVLNQDFNFYEYYTLGATLKLKGFYLDLAILADEDGISQAFTQIGLGYQKALNK